MSWIWSDSPMLLMGGRRLNTYPTWKLTVTSPPQSAVEVLELQDAKDACRIDDNPGEDPQLERKLNGWIASARIAAENLQGRDLVQKQRDIIWDYWPQGINGRIELPDPLNSVDLVQYKDATLSSPTALVLGTDYDVYTDKAEPHIAPAYGKTWPTFTIPQSSAVLIRCSSGFAPTDAFWSLDAGPAIKEGMRMLINFWYDNPDALNRGIGNIEEFPYTVTQLLSMGSAYAKG